MVGYAFHYKKKSIIDQDEQEGEEEGAVIVLGKRRERRRKEVAEAAAAAAAAASSSSSAPASAEGWVEVLVQTDFFGVCEQHKEERKSEENIYCVDCCRRMCPHCLGGTHAAHRLLQIRRYVYQDVVRVHDMHSLLDCSKVQSYTVNSAKVVLLKPRRQSKPLKSNPCGTACEICRRSISDPNRYCSISCLVSDVGAGATMPQASPSQPSVPHQTADAEAAVQAEEPPCGPASPQPSNAGREDNCRWILEPPKRRVHRRKAAVPRRSPLL